MGYVVINLLKIKLPITPSVLAIAAATVITAMPTTATAQTGEEAAEATDAGFGDIVVTARKRAEDMLKTPVAITAVGSEQLGKQGIASVADLSASTPSMNLNNNNSGRNDRSFQQIIIRGFVPSNAQNPTTSTFIDGVPVSSPTAFNAISDPERIEILRGPQSAYFGRNTFAGAMNVVSKEPGNDFAGSASVTVGTRANYRVQAAIEGAIVEDALNFRISAGENSKNGSYRNAFTGETLGDQKTRFISGSIVAKPIDGLKIKALGIFSQDRDGAPANGVISAYGVTDANGNKVVEARNNCSFTVPKLVSGQPVFEGGQQVFLTNPFMCGTVRNLSLQPSANTTLDSYTSNFLNNPAGRLMPGLTDYGLMRDFYHLHLNINYDIGDTGFSVSSLSGMNREKYGQYSDLDGYGSVLVPNRVGAAGRAEYYDYPYLVERTNSDFSQELRLAYDNGGPLQGTVGLSYLNNWTQGSRGTPVSASGRSAISGMTRSRTKGAFFGLSYKFTPQFTVNAEGRYQSDTLYAYASPGGQTFDNSVLIKDGDYAEGDTILRKTYNNFLPRVIAQYDFGREAMIYASWAKGVNPGQFNTGFLTQSQAAVDKAAAAGIRVGVDPEKVTNYEVGVKGRLLDNRLNYSLSAYFAQWRNQANLLTEWYDDPASDTDTPVQLNGQVNSGAVDMKGIELDLGYRLSDLITIGAAGSLNDSHIKSFVSNAITGLTGITDFTGKEVPFTSKWSASTNVEFHGDVQGLDDASWFARADYMFKSGVWSNQANIAKTPDIHKVNIRAGISRGPIALEAFVTNLFNNKAFTTIGDNWLNTPGTPLNPSYTGTISALSVGLPELRTAGMQIKYKF